jgi:hypothetical protein
MRNPSSIRSRVATALMMLLALAAAPGLARALDVEVWTDRGDDAVYKTGDAMRIKLRASADAYLLVYEIDAVGAVNLLFPFDRSSAYVQGGSTVRLPVEESGLQLIVGEETGQGFIVAVASERPFRDLPWFLRPFDPQAASVGYDAPQDSAMTEEGFDERGHVLGDPYVAMERIRRRVVDAPENADGIASDYTTYYVHEVVRYPRYLCNDCHRPGHWAWWSGFDPYYTSCSVFDFRVNWRWYWGPTLWTGYVPYYYYVVRTDCPPYYTPWYGNQYRFSSWDGRTRWTDLWGGNLRRYKPTAAPVSYTPPPPRGMIWRKGETPPGFVPPDVRTRTAGGGGMRDVLTRQREGRAGGPIWRGKPGSQGTSGTSGRTGLQPGGRAKPADGGSSGGEVVKGRGGQRPQGGATPETKESGESKPRGWWRPPVDRPSGGGDKAKDPPKTQPKERPRDQSNPPPSNPPPSDPPPSNPPPRNDGGSKPPPSSPPPRNDGGYRPPPSNPPPSNPPPRWNPPPSRPSPPAGRGGKGGGSG